MGRRAPPHRDAERRGRGGRPPRRGAAGGAGHDLHLDRILVANATGCSSIYGGNLPTTPWSANGEGRGPAWSNSLFEDNAEFGLGLRLALDAERDAARRLCERLAPVVGEELVDAILSSAQDSEEEIGAQRARVAELVARLDGDAAAEAARQRLLADALVRTTVWIVGGDGWAYDIGFGGLDHVLASGHDVNVLVLDTEVYSNTGGQASKATPRGAAAKFAVGGKPTAKKDLGFHAMAHPDTYVAQVALGANDIKTVKAFLEAEAWPGPSIIIAHSPCNEHGIDMSRSASHEKDVVRSGYWPLYRRHPGLGPEERSFRLDSHEPQMSVRELARDEDRFAALVRRDPERAEQLLALAQADVDERWQRLKGLSSRRGDAPGA